MLKKQKPHKATTAVAGHKVKRVKLKAHHAKPYRKRHYGGLLIAVALLITFFVFAVRYRTHVNTALDKVASLVSTKPVKSEVSIVGSDYGFSVNYNADLFNVSAIEQGSNTVYQAADTSTKRQYNTVQFTPASGLASGNFTALSIMVNPVKLTINDISPDKVEQQFAITNSKSLNAERVSLEEATIGGKQFRKTVWKVTPKSPALKDSKPITTTLYTAIHNERAIAIKITGAATDASLEYKTVLDGISFGSPSAEVTTLPPNQNLLPTTTASRSMLVSALFPTVSAAAPSVNASERVSAQFSPAVVKIYNLRCGAITYKGQKFSNRVCENGTGSGFIISADGYIGTNGHVAVTTPKEILASASLYDDEAFYIVAGLSGVTETEINDMAAEGKTVAEAIVFVYQKYYEIPDTDFGLEDDTNNLMVSFGNDQPDVKDMVTKTYDGVKLEETNTLKHAELIGYDYAGTIDVVSQKFSASDVALLKLSGDNYPLTKLGSISGLSSGQGLNILGFPGNANDKSLVDETKSTVTLTTGKVSSIKDDSSGKRKIIETDTTIGNGNSGGPAFDDNGNVVGLATYTSTGSERSKGTFNYIRDIQDLKSVVDSKKVSLNLKSSTQSEWDKGLDSFYTARYSKSLKNFAKVKASFPAHSKVDEFVKVANEKIKNGEDVKDFPIVFAAIGAAGLIGVAVMVVVIVRHRKKHGVYNQQVATGSINPMAPGSPAQHVTLNPAQYPAVNTAGLPPHPALPSAPVQEQAPIQPMAPPAPTFAAPAPPAPQAPTPAVNTEQPQVVQPNVITPTQQPPIDPNNPQ